MCIILVMFSNFSSPPPPPVPGKLQEKISHCMVWVSVFIFILITQHASPIFLYFSMLHQTYKHVVTWICGNKIPTRCNRWFLLQIFLLAQHVSGTTMPIIRSSRVLYKWLLPVVFGALVFKLSVWCGVEGYVSGWRAVAAARKPDTKPSAPHHTDNFKTKASNTTGSNHLYNTLELLMMGIMASETCWASNKICNKNSSVASSWHFISTVDKVLRMYTQFWQTL